MYFWDYNMGLKLLVKKKLPIEVLAKSAHIIRKISHTDSLAVLTGEYLTVQSLEPVGENSKAAQNKPS